MISSITLILVMINAQLVVKSIVILPSICTMLVLFCIFFVVGVYWCYNDTHFFGIFSLFQNNAWHDLPANLPDPIDTAKPARGLQTGSFFSSRPVWLKILPCGDLMDTADPAWGSTASDLLICLIVVSVTEDPILWCSLADHTFLGALIRSWMTIL